MTVGQMIRIGIRPDGTPEYAKVIFVHRRHSFAVIERTVPYGNTIRETRYIGNRKCICYK